MERNWKELYEQGKIVNGTKGFCGEFSFLSNFYNFHDLIFILLPYKNPTEEPPEWFFDDSIEYLYQASKTLNKEEMGYLRSFSTPGQIKRAGRRITLRADWEEIKDEVMEYLVREKFKIPKLRDKLLAIPDDMYIVEMNHWNDTYWGVNKRTFEGQNKLGEILMKIRRELRSQK